VIPGITGAGKGVCWGDGHGKGLPRDPVLAPQVCWAWGEGLFAVGCGVAAAAVAPGSAMSSRVDAAAAGWRGGDASKLPGRNKSCTFSRHLWPNQAELVESP